MDSVESPLVEVRRAGWCPSQVDLLQQVNVESTQPSILSKPNDTSAENWDAVKLIFTKKIVELKFSVSHKMFLMAAREKCSKEQRCCAKKVKIEPKECFDSGQ